MRLLAGATRGDPMSNETIKEELGIAHEAD
jgi:hypothetical protein